jgi:hypothetical protein
MAAWAKQPVQFPWRQGCSHPTKNRCVLWFALLILLGGGGSVNENCSLVPSRFGVSLVCYGGSCNLVVLVGLFTTCAYFACCPQLACCPTNILHAFLNLRAIVSSRGFLVFYLLEAVLVWHNAFIILL